MSVTIKDWREDYTIYTLPGADTLVGADLSNLNLTGADLSYKDLTGANLSCTNLGGANLIGANFTAANLYSANLVMAYLGGANLTSANCYRTHFYRADLSGAVLVHTNLYYATLRGAHLCRTRMSYAFTSRADLTGAIIADGWVCTGKFHYLYIKEKEEDQVVVELYECYNRDWYMHCGSFSGPVEEFIFYSEGERYKSSIVALCYES